MIVNIACGALYVALLALPGCRSEGANNVLERERLTVIGWTLPPGGSIDTDTGIRRSGQHAEATWEESAPMTWEQYGVWNKERSKIGYAQTRSDDRSASFARTLPGDRFSVDIAVIAAGSPLRLRVTFTAYPD